MVHSGDGSKTVDHLEESHLLSAKLEDPAGLSHRTSGGDAGSNEEDYIVEVEAIEQPYSRKGKTRFPRDLVNTRLITELGYSFKEEVSRNRLLACTALIVL